MKDSKHFGKLWRFLLLMMVISAPVGCSNANGNNAPTAEPTSIPVTPINEAGTIKVETARLRVLPDVTSEQMGTLHRDSKVMVIGISSDGNWYLVKATGLQKDAWIAVEFVGLGTLPPTKTATEAESVISTSVTSSKIASTFTATPTSTPSATARSNGTATRKPKLQSTATSTATLMRVDTPTNTPTFIATPTDTAIATSTPTDTNAATDTPTEPSKPTPTDTPIPVGTPTPADTPTPMDNPTPTETPI